jgi:RecA/RadA recombinase
MADKPERKLVPTYGDQVETRRQTFLDNRGILPVGTLTIFAGRGGEGKTTLALDYAARVTRGDL